MKYVLPMVLVNYVHKKTGTNQRSTQESMQKEGTTIIDKKPTSTSKENTVGEYVDYEEID